LAALLARDDIKALIFTGTGDVFLSGANIRELAQLDAEGALEFSTFGQNIFQTIAEAKQITISAINGYCMGGGLDLALACDIRVASEAAVFSHPGARLGIMTGWGGTQRLPRIVGRSNALEFLATSRRYSSEEAFEIGLISGVTDPVLGDALKLAQQSPRKRRRTVPGALVM
jgi:enoyl-CoA hydratase